MKTKIAVAVRCMKDKDYTYHYANTDYLYMLDKIDALGVPIFPLMDAKQAALTCDGLLLPGGADLNPALYHQLPDPTVTDYFDEIDALDLNLIQAFMQQHKPILGICRGLQVLNVAFGGTLIQDIPNHSQKADRHVLTHEVKIVKDSQLASIFNESTQVNSLHHQVIDRLGDGLKAVAFSSKGYIEAIEADNILAVQWHPEALTHEPDQLKLFKSFIKQCQK